jgi:hypothetical protein
MKKNWAMFEIAHAHDNIKHTETNLARTMSHKQLINKLSQFLVFITGFILCAKNAI